MSVLTDVMRERENWARRHRAVTVHHHYFMLVAESALVSEALLLLVMYKELVLVFVTNLVGK